MIDCALPELTFPKNDFYKTQISIHISILKKKMKNKKIDKFSIMKNEIILLLLSRNPCCETRTRYPIVIDSNFGILIILLSNHFSLIVRVDMFTVTLKSHVYYGCHRTVGIVKNKTNV